MNDQPKHTPRPWKPAGRYATHIIDASGRMIADAPHPNGMMSDEGYANRDLIAAAPDLLEALKYITLNCRVFCEDSMDIADGAVYAARAAIAKAEGRDA